MPSVIYPKPKVNHVKEIYAAFYPVMKFQEKIAELLTPSDTKAEVQIVYQTLEGLHSSCPGHPGDWYFSGNYPTPGGMKLVNEAFINYVEQEF